MDPTTRSSALYYRLPVAAQNLALAFAGLRRRRTRFGPVFERRLEFMRSSEQWDRSDINSYKDGQIAALVAGAYRDVPYYRRVMDDRGLSPDDIQSMDDLVKLPILTKDDIRANFADLISTSADRRSFVEVQTSGSTGAPLRILTTRDAIAFKWAVWWRHREWYGMKRGDLHAIVMTKPLVSPSQQRPPYWRWNRTEHQAIIPMQQITPAKTDAIVAFLNRTPFEFYSGYPSILHSLAVHAGNTGLTVENGPRVIFTGAEGLLDHQRADLERFAGAPTAEMYGFNEGAGNASSCRQGYLHEDFEFGHMECVDSEMDESDGTIEGRVVATGFSTAGFPLIRYDVGDAARWMPDSFRCPCGRQGRVIASITGRWEDYVVTPDGHQARRLGEIFKELPTLKQFQMIQTTVDRVTLRLAVREAYSTADEDRLRRRVALWISESLVVDFEYVERIEPAPNGKYQRIVSTLAQPPGGSSA